MSLLEKNFPWKLVSLALNKLILSTESLDIGGLDFPDKHQPLPEDFAQRGLLWVDEYYPDGWFSSAEEEPECLEETPEMTRQRSERCLFLGGRLAASCKGLMFDKETRRFGAVSQCDLGSQDWVLIEGGEGNDLDLDTQEAIETSKLLLETTGEDAICEMVYDFFNLSLGK
ncbi:hypothetical protein ColLi_12359 [Colletotrichum liriopes]|uniref:Uncharacterized protein n=1 Tax=Colletotrichum liriopes TaxID=708192 RepID=A0AA37GY89_9PEZI|nr:hypothetical protein ColLi_12359 [Colletotrichum liriopes]